MGSASGHREESKGAILKAGEEDTVILKTYNDSTCFIGQSGRDSEHNYYKINVESLVEFIKQSGIQVDKYSEEFQMLEKSQG